MQLLTRTSARGRALTLPALTGLALLAVAGAPPAHAAKEYFRSYPVGAHPIVRVNTDDGSVRVTTTNANQVEFHVRYEHSGWGLMFGAPPRVYSEQSGNTVELIARTVWGMVIGFSSTRMHIDVSMPRNADLELQTGDGSVALSSLNGDIRVRTDDGAIWAAQLSGNIDLHSADGSITVSTLQGDVQLHTSDGTIRADNLSGSCHASSSDGAIQIAGRFNLLDARSDDGNIIARAYPSSQALSSWMLSTLDGSVDLSLPSDFKADLDVSTSDGHIRSELPVQIQGDFERKHIHGTLNGGGPLVTVHTDDGSIQLEAI